jgi:hypothetical protein
MLNMQHYKNIFHIQILFNYYFSNPIHKTESKIAK